MTGLNRQIAESGERIYENIRQGWIERPDEARARTLQETKLAGEQQANEIRGLQVQNQQNTLDEYDAGTEIRELERAKKKIEMSPDYIAKKTLEAEELRKANLDRVRAVTSDVYSKITVRESGRVDARKLAQGTKYAKLIASAAAQKDDASMLAFLKTNFDSIMEAGDDEQDASNRALLNSADGSEEQKQLLAVLRDGEPAFAKHARDMEKFLAKQKAKGKGKASKVGSPSKRETASALTMVRQDDILGDLPGLGDGKDQKDLADAISYRAKQIQAASRDLGEGIDFLDAMVTAKEEAKRNVNAWLPESNALGLRTSKINTALIFGDDPIPTGEVAVPKQTTDSNNPLGLNL